MGKHGKWKPAAAITGLAFFMGYLVETTALGQANANAGGGATVTVQNGNAGVTIGGGGGGGWGGGWMSVNGSGASALSSWSDGNTTVRRATDGQHDITLTTTAGVTTAVVKDAAGNVLFNGPYTTDADKARVPAEVADKLANLSAPPADLGGMGMGRVPGMTGAGPGGAGGRLSLGGVKAALGATDQEWSDLQEKVKLVLTLQGYLAPGGGSPALLPTAAPGDNPIAGAETDLGRLTADPQSTEADLEAKVAAVREARKKVQTDLAAARKALEGAATARQRAVLVQLGVLE